MKQIKNFLKEEKAAAQMVEAAIIYPIVFLIIFLMIYIGLYILQAITIGTYAQKFAILASREISQPGYSTLLSMDKYSNSAVEMDTADAIIGTDSDGKKSSAVNVDELSKKITDFSVLYRYWSKDPMKTGKESYENALKKMVEENSIIVPQNNGVLNVTIECDNNIISQFVTVKVEQELMHFAVLDFFGVKSPTVSATAVATVSDTDELIRTTDFAADCITALASKLGIDIGKARETVDSAFTKLGIKYDD